jgi:hypothetical protein
VIGPFAENLVERSLQVAFEGVAAIRLEPPVIAGNFEVMLEQVKVAIAAIM